VVGTWLNEACVPRNANCEFMQLIPTTTLPITTNGTPTMITTTTTTTMPTIDYQCFFKAETEKIN